MRAPCHSEERNDEESKSKGRSSLGRASQMGTVFIADGAPQRRRWREASLHLAGLPAATVASEDELFEALSHAHPHAVVVDQGLPHRGGLAACQRLRENAHYRFTPVLLMLRGHQSLANPHALEMGCTDTLPSTAPQRLFQARVASLVRLSQESYPPFPVARAVAVVVEAAAIKDPDFRREAYQGGRLAAAVGDALGLSEEERRLLWTAGVLHDIGVVGLLDQLRQRRGPLTVNEYRNLQKHTANGEAICAPLGMPHLQEAIRHHHERWDGQGYPDSLSGEAIPLAARVLAVADAYLALTKDRPHRWRVAREEALDEMRFEAGRQLDPGLVETFVALVRTEGL